MNESLINGEIIKYIVKKYEPHTMIVYGSYADGSNNANSDFDALIITDKKFEFHDGNIINGVLLDVFIYNTSEFNEEINCEKYIQIHDGKILIDKYDMGKKLKNKVCDFIKNTPKKSIEEKRHGVEWCEKMLLRTKREDVEGYFRWHWLLVDSLEIYFILCDEYYYGPKKSLLLLKEKDIEAYNYYENALIKFDSKSLKEWIDYLKSLLYAE
ncbi:MAG: nucleotidyltransferase domain-containing protein [Clostridium sp.]